MAHAAGINDTVSFVSSSREFGTSVSDLVMRSDRLGSIGICEPTTKEKGMKNKVYEALVIKLDDNGDMVEDDDNSYWTWVAKSPNEAKIHVAIRVVEEGDFTEYGKDFTILVREFKGE